jgi:murein L,D-transpeptidase YafK
MRPLIITALLLAGTCAALAAVGTRARAVDSANICVGEDARVVVDLTRHTLALCEKQKATATFDVRLGRGGIGKTREGDGKTPIGTYALGEPRPSKRYGTFIPIGYPTDAQKKQGHTGSAVGVHGPPRWAQWLGSLVNTFDLSDGCVGVARDSEIDAIANWVNARAVRTIELR